MRCRGILAAGLVVAVSGGLASAQMPNRPFAFPNTPTGGVGMSVGGKQAILNERFTGQTPNVLVRDSAGGLLTLRDGPNGVAIVSVPGGDFIPGFRGRSYKGASTGMSVGAFNAFFVPNRSGASNYLPTRVSSDESVTVWTARVVSSGGATLGVGGPVDVWTALVYGM